jgi:peroxiredoxin
MQSQIINLKGTSGIFVDLIEGSESGESVVVRESVDFQSLFCEYAKVVIFAVPGAFTPTCSSKHLPEFISNAQLIFQKDVDVIYCLSVNDKFVMKAWAESTPGFLLSKIKMIADGNGDVVKALQLNVDRTDKRMGLRSARFAAIIEFGNITTLQVDDSGLDKTSAEHVLRLLS